MWCSGFGTSPVPRVAFVTPGSRCTAVRRSSSICLRAPAPRSASASSARRPRTQPCDRLPPPPRPAPKRPRSTAAAAAPAAPAAPAAAARQPPCPARHARAQTLGRKLLRAACRGRLRAVRRLIGAGADVNFVSCGHAPALFFAAQKGHADVVCFLLNRGADVNARSCHGGSALHAAAHHDYRGRVMDFLVAGGADLDARDRAGRTPLHLAAEAGNALVVKKLLAAGASRKIRDAGGLTPYHLASSVYIRHLIRPPVCPKVRPTCTIDEGRGNLYEMWKAQCIVGYRPVK